MAVIESSTKTMCRSFSFDVEDLKSTLDDTSFLELIQKHEVIILTETWKADTLKINIEGFWD